MNTIIVLTSTQNRDYLDALYRTYEKMLVKFAASIVEGNESAEDVVTNAMLSLFSMVPELRAMGELERVGYLRKTVRNAAYKYYNAYKRKSATELPLDHDLLFSLPGEDKDPADLLIQEEDYRAVRAAIADLPEQDRRVLHLKYAADLTSEEIAKLTGAPSAAAVRERLTRARRKVLARLNEGGWSDAEQGYSGATGADGGWVVSADH